MAKSIPFLYPCTESRPRKSACSCVWMTCSACCAVYGSSTDDNKSSVFWPLQHSTVTLYSMRLSTGRQWRSSIQRSIDRWPDSRSCHMLMPLTGRAGLFGTRRSRSFILIYLRTTENKKVKYTETVKTSSLSCKDKQIDESNTDYLSTVPRWPI